MQKYAHLVELEKCCQTHILLQNFVLIQPRTSPPKICKNLKNLPILPPLPLSPLCPCNQSFKGRTRARRSLSRRPPRRASERPRGAARRRPAALRERVPSKLRSQRAMRRPLFLFSMPRPLFFFFAKRGRLVLRLRQIRRRYGM